MKNSQQYEKSGTSRHNEPDLRFDIHAKLTRYQRSSGQCYQFRRHYASRLSHLISGTSVATSSKFFISLFAAGEWRTTLATILTHRHTPAPCGIVSIVQFLETQTQVIHSHGGSAASSKNEDKSNSYQGIRLLVVRNARRCRIDRAEGITGFRFN